MYESREVSKGIAVQEECSRCLGRYRAVSLTSQMLHNVNVNVDFYIRLSCELVG